MSEPSPRTLDGSVALSIDLYELTMARAYWSERRFEPATFGLSVRRLPERRNFLLACGLDDALRCVERLRFDDDALRYLATLELFPDEFLAWLAGLRFTGEIRAVAEGTPMFAGEPLLEVVAPLPEAQIVETLLMNQIHLQTVMASKAARIVAAAAGRRVVDFGLRRMHGIDAGVKAARAFYIAGVDATSNVLAGRRYGVPVAGTMAHSYVQAHDREADALRAFVECYPEAVLLVDTYDTLEGVRQAIRVMREQGDGCRVTGVRLDSGDLAELATRARALLDEAGFERVGVFVSGGLDEDAIARIVARCPSVAGFGVGTAMGVSADAPALDMAYKLTDYAGRGRLKLSPGKATLPGRKQVFRIERRGRAERDVVALDGERRPGRPLLRPVMLDGRRCSAPQVDLPGLRETARAAIAQLPARIRGLAPARPPYPVSVSEALLDHRDEVAERLRGRITRPRRMRSA